MTTLTTDPLTPTTTPDDAPSRLLPRLGGVCLALAPIVFTAGLATAPHQDDLTSAGYVASLADHPTQAALSANLLHYSWFFFAFGLLAVIGLVRGRRGRGLTTVAAVAGAAAAIQISGLLMVDFFVADLGSRIGVEETVAVQDDLGVSVAVWLFSGQVVLLLIPLTFIGLARARVISWWLAPLPLAAFAIGAVGLPAAIAVPVGLACWAPLFVAAHRLVTGPRR
ncbi:hypothetical protein GCM10023340_31870 [Nocardioides marinquilinus]|uniref:DUF4386 family protein n=1 Tax=Nocardioides marinquilinus TaxID=1210400 RepID=A0ABP9PU12_9ACTN